MEKKLSVRPFLGFPYDDLWETDLYFGSGLSISEDKDYIYVEAPLPGLSEKEIEVSFENGVLWVRGEKSEQEEDKKKKYYRKASSAFSYHVRVPGQVNEKKDPEATYKDGVLRVSFEKAAQTQVKKIPVKKKGS